LSEKRDIQSDIQGIQSRTLVLHFLFFLVSCGNGSSLLEISPENITRKIWFQITLNIIKRCNLMQFADAAWIECLDKMLVVESCWELPGHTHQRSQKVLVHLDSSTVAIDVGIREGMRNDVHGW